MAGKLAEQEAGLPQRRRDHDRKTALQHGPGRFERGHCALAALSRGVEQQSRSGGEQHIALPGIEGQLGDALGPGDGIVERGGLSWCQSCERAAEQGQLALEGGGAHAERRLHARHRIGGVGELLARAGPVDQLALLHEDDIGGPLEVAPLTFGWRAEEAQQRLKLLCGNGSA